MAQFAIPRYIFTGKNALAEATAVLRDAGKRAFIVTGPHIARSSMMDVLAKTLSASGISYFIYDRIFTEPTVLMIEDGVAAFRGNRCDFLIGIGGGSPLDAAKAISFMLDNTGKLSDYCGRDLHGDTAAVIAIPTTAGTGSEATRFTVITDPEKRIKMLLKGDCLIPHAAVVDPAFTVDMPKSITAATGLDALTHAIEAYTSVKATPLTDALALSAVQKIMTHLPIAYRSGAASAREEMAVAALEAGICINNASVTLVHGLSRPIGALFHIPHGLSNAMLLKECLSFAKDGAPQRFADLAAVSGVPVGNESTSYAASKFIDKVAELLQICEVMSFAEYGINAVEFDSAIEKMAADAMASGSPQNTRRTVCMEDCIRIYQKTYR